MSRIVIFFTLLMLATQCHAKLPVEPNSTQRASQAVNELADRYVARYFEHFPEQATLLGIEDADHGKLSDHSLEALAKWHQQEDEMMSRLELIDPELLAESPEYVTYYQLKEQLEASTNERICRSELWEIGPLHGWQAMTARLAEKQPLGNNTLRKQALVRWQQLPRYLDQEINNLRHGMGLGFTAAKPVVEKVIAQLNLIIDTPVKFSPLYVPGNRDNNMIFHAHFQQLLHNEVYPAIVAYRDFMQNEYLPKARSEVGVRALPKGKYCYRAKIRANSTLNFPARTVHRQGLVEMKKIHKKLQEISNQSFDGLSSEELLNYVRTAKQYKFDSEADILAYNYQALKRIKPHLHDYFEKLPIAPVELKPYPPFQAEMGAPGEYMPPLEDGSQPGIFMINTYDAEHQSKVDAESTLFHETMPGHHLQVALALEQKHLHPLSRYFLFSGFIEGWALYSEQLADEMGMYSSDLDKVGLLSSQAMRAARLVVDPGLHALGWSREKAIQYMLANTALSEELATAEIDRYISMPGQATSYTLGALEIQNLRSKAEKKLGPRFNIKTFHQHVLNDGNVSLMFLRNKINRWLKS